MPEEDARPLSWLMIEPGWHVAARDGSEIGRVKETVGDSGADIFSGISVSTGVLDRARFVPAENVTAIEEGLVVLDLSAEDVEQLEPHEAPPSLRIQADTK